jgi:ribosomal protein S18 acetylase RimI-like enzyme
MLELARECDWDAVNRLSVQIHDLHAAWRPDIYCHSDEPLPKDVFLQAISERMLYVAKIQEQVAGYVLLSVQQRGGPGQLAYKALRLDAICVDEAVRGQGIGKEMVAGVRALARVFGCRELILGVHPENDSAVSFYQKCGFRIRTINMDCKV